MTALVTEHLPLVAGAPEGIKKLRALILDLAIQGKLVPQDPADPTGDVLLGSVNAASLPENKSPFALPLGWAWTRFAELLDFQGGGQPPKSEFSDVQQHGYVQLIQIRDLGEKPQPVFVRREAVSKFCTSEDILVGRYGASVGKIFWGKDGAYNVALVKMVDRYAMFDRRFLYLLLSSPLGQSYFSGISRSAQDGFNKGDIADRPLPVCSVLEQHRIVAKVDELMALCDRLEADQADAEAAHAQLVQALLDSLIQATDAADFRAHWQRLSEHFHTLFTTEASIDALKQTVLQLAVMGKLVSQCMNDEPASELLARKSAASLKATKTGSGATPLPVELPFKLPDGWAWARFNDLIAPDFPIAYGVLVPGPESADGVPFVRIADLDLVAPKRLPEKRISPEVDAQFARTKLRGGEILMGVVGSIGKLGLAPASWAGANIARAVCRIVPIGAVSTPYVLWLLQTQFMRQQFLGDTRTLAQPTLNIGLIRDALTPVPPLAEQHRIVAKVDELMALCDQLKAQLAEARQQHAQLSTALIEQAVA